MNCFSGDTGSTVESYHAYRDYDYSQTARIELDFGPNNEFNIDIVTYASTVNIYSSLSKIEVKKTSYNTHTLTVVDDVDTWSEGKGNQGSPKDFLKVHSFTHRVPHTFASHIPHTSLKV